jgi:hypothetical protein
MRAVLGKRHLCAQEVQLASVKSKPLREKFDAIFAAEYADCVRMRAPDQEEGSGLHPTGRFMVHVRVC